MNVETKWRVCVPAQPELGPKRCSRSPLSPLAPELVSSWGKDLVQSHAFGHLRAAPFRRVWEFPKALLVLSSSEVLCSCSLCSAPCSTARTCPEQRKEAALSTGESEYYPFWCRTCCRGSPFSAAFTDTELRAIRVYKHGCAKATLDPHY